MQIVEKKVSELKAYEKNPRKNDKAVGPVAESIKEFGFKVPIIVDKDNVIVAGHTRLKAAKKLGMKTVPCIVADDLTPEQIKAFRLADNSTAQIAEWDLELLKDELMDLDFDMSLFGLEKEIKDIERIFAPEIIEDEVPEVDEKNIITKPGDLWILGRHRLLCGDATKKEDVERLMDGKKADIEFTSPPYNAGASEKLSGNTHTTDSKYLSNNDDLDNYDELLYKSTENGILFSRYAIINIQMLAGNKLVFCDYLSRFKHNLCDVGVWVKTTTAPAMAERVMNSQFEFVLFFSSENNSRAVGTKNFRGTVSNVYECSPQRNNEFSNIHAATFSVEFVSHYINNFSNKKDKVLDLFGGTGTTLIACEQLNRTCYMMELDPIYCDVILQRYINLKGTSQGVYRINADGTKTKYDDIT